MRLERRRPRGKDPVDPAGELVQRLLDLGLGLDAVTGRRVESVRGPAAWHETIYIAPLES